MRIRYVVEAALGVAAMIIAMYGSGMILFGLGG
jgi:hypothetical protein